jgi:hypothetical protein
MASFGEEFELELFKPAYNTAEDTDAYTFGLGWFSDPTRFGKTPAFSSATRGCVRWIDSHRSCSSTLALVSARCRARRRPLMLVLWSQQVS